MEEKHTLLLQIPISLTQINFKQDSPLEVEEEISLGNVDSFLYFALMKSGVKVKRRKAKIKFITLRHFQFSLHTVL